MTYMMYLLSLMMISTSMASLLSFHPLPLGVIILLMAFIITMFISLSISSWFSMSLFLIYIGGLMVMFTYFLATQPNQPVSLTLMYFSLVLNSIFILMTNPITHLPITFLSSFASSTFILSLQNTTIIWMLGIILLLIMIIVVKITSQMSSPLRPFTT